MERPYPKKRTLFRDSAFFNKRLLPLKKSAFSGVNNYQFYSDQNPM